MEKYRDRRDAGQRLAILLHRYANQKDVIVLALPRGGLPVADEVAHALHLPLDIFIVRKLGVPGQIELAMGAIASGRDPIFNDTILKDLNVTQDEVRAVLEKETAELIRREQQYRGTQPLPMLKNKIVILIDDGIATGATMKAAIQAIRAQEVARMIVAVPVADKLLCDEMHLLADEFVCPMPVTPLQAVGAWYHDFSQTEDEEVSAILSHYYKKLS